MESFHIFRGRRGGGTEALIGCWHLNASFDSRPSWAVVDRRNTFKYYFCPLSLNALCLALATGSFFRPANEEKYWPGEDTPLRSVLLWRRKSLAPNILPWSTLDGLPTGTTTNSVAQETINTHDRSSPRVEEACRQDETTSHNCSSPSRNYSGGERNSSTQRQSFS